MQTNTDDIRFAAGELLPVIEEFYTVQGEGYNMGLAAYFLRVGGCDVGCRWCDTKFSWKRDLHQLVAVDQVVQRVLDTGARAVVVTGGEPTTYNLHYLTQQLKQHGIETFIETSGAYPLTGQWDWICLSPKIQTPPQEDIYARAHELKLIVLEPDNFAWAEATAAKVSAQCHLFLQPEWSKYEQLIPSIVEYVKTHQQWRISLQAHKFMHIP